MRQPCPDCFNKDAAIEGLQENNEGLVSDNTRLRMENAALRRVLELKAINDNEKITGYDVTECP